MAISLYDVSVAGFLQTLEAVEGYLEKGLSHCRETGLDPEAVVETSFFSDMKPFRYQIRSIAHHSLGAIESVKSGVFQPPSPDQSETYADLQALIAKTRAGLARVTPDEVNAREGSDVVFDIPNFRMVFTAENFLMSFSLPNFHFHATTAYDILRSKGAPIGKLNYLGKLRLKT